MEKHLKKFFDLKNRAASVMYQAFVPLAPIETQSGQLTGLYSSGDFSTFFQRLFFFALSLGAIFAVVRLMYAGYLYMGQDMWKTQQKARDIFSGVIFGLLLLLAIWLILRTINPQLLNLDILTSIKSQPSKGLTAPANAQPTKTSCDGSRAVCDEKTGESLVPATATP